jgi:predicted ATPase
MRLHMEDAFVGREAEAATLTSLSQSLVVHKQQSRNGALSSCPLQVCLVHGVAGSGKTSLVHHTLRPLARHKQNKRNQQHQNGSYYYISGKCDQNQVFSSPYGEIVSAFDQLVTECGAPPERIQQCLTTEARILTRLIPSFRNLLLNNDSVEHDDDDADENDEEHHHHDDTDAAAQQNSDDNPQEDGSGSSLTLAFERLVVAFRVFLREFCNSEHPIILFIDDLQVRKAMQVYML